MNPPPPYDPILAAMACRLSSDIYLPREEIEATHPNGEFFPGDCGSCFVVFAGGRTWVVFEGTHDLPSLIQDFDVKRRACSGGGSVHAGFDGGLDKVWDSLFLFLRKFALNEIIFTGHSAGATKAILAAKRWLDFRPAAGPPLASVANVFPFAPARPGDATFRDSYNAVLGGITWCWQHGADIVPWEPPYILGNRGVGHCVWHDDLTSQSIIDPGLARMAIYCGAVTYAGWRKRPPQIEQLADHHISKYLALFDSLNNRGDAGNGAGTPPSVAPCFSPT